MTVVHSFIFGAKIQQIAEINKENRQKLHELVNFLTIQKLLGFFGVLWVQKYKKSLIIRTITRNSLDDWKIKFIFAAVNIQY